jgi:hypothetical protein
MTASREKATTPLIYTTAGKDHFRLQVRAKIPMGIRLEYGDMARILGPEIDISYPRFRAGGFVSHHDRSLNIAANGFQYTNLDPIVDKIDDLVVVQARVTRLVNEDEADHIDDTIFIIGDKRGKNSLFHKESSSGDYVLGLAGVSRRVHHVPVSHLLVSLQEYALTHLRQHYTDIRNAGLVGPISTLWTAIYLWKEHNVPILLSDIGSPKATKNVLRAHDHALDVDAQLPDELYWDELIGLTKVRLLVDRTTSKRFFMDRLSEYDGLDSGTIQVLEAQADELDNIAHTYRLLAAAKKEKLNE